MCDDPSNFGHGDAKVISWYRCSSHSILVQSCNLGRTFNPGREASWDFQAEIVIERLSIQASFKFGVNPRNLPLAGNHNNLSEIADKLLLHCLPHGKSWATRSAWSGRYVLPWSLPAHGPKRHSCVLQPLQHVQIHHWTLPMHILQECCHAWSTK